MAISRRRLGAVAAAALLAAGTGCGGGRPSVDTGTEEVMVSGKVTLNGKPATGTISFDPSNVERKNAAARSTPINEDGSYTITTLIGQNRVSFSGPEISKNPDILNAAYMHDLQAGENKLDFDLPLDEGLSGG
ncbi:hypothetical protein [Tautonia plasticadhaerens]|uniref:Carboxypeptidase regulatory-like domain-containing protein n=1 Tax=Tautonia plasticadhaerens TaxID=2527974 RepID=A0A518HD34_9BACT|nr:hypothetical protein [Tautonia plasticadhaerens]QDV38778.1 hypothetical protein ElP_67350 [Tautonia plasticadhaerens]